MTGSTRLWKAAALACLLAGPVPLAAQVNLTADQLRGFAAELVAEGDAPRALAVTEALLNRNPQDVGALILRAQAALALGESGLALDAASTAYDAAKDDGTRYIAARLAARAHAEQRQDTRAQIWLRRARQYAPDARSAEDVAEDYRFLRDRNPWSTQLRFGVSPTNNVNNGSSSETVLLFSPFGVARGTLNAEARALSGLAINAGATTSYRLAESRTAITFLDATADAVTYVLSETAEDALRADRDEANARREERCADTAANNIALGEQRIADGEALIAQGEAADPVDATLIAEGEALIEQGEALVRAGENPAPCELDDSPLPTGSDYAYATLSFGLTHRQILAPGWLPTTASFRYAKAWYGGEAYSDTITLGIAQDWALGEDARITARAFAERRSFEAIDDPTTRIGASATWRKALASGDQLALTGSATRSISDRISSHYRSLSLGVDYDLAQPVAGVGLGFSVTAARDYDYDFDLRFLANRVDNSLTARVDATLTDFEYFGFQPVVSVEARAVESNVDRYDQRTVSLGFDFRSSF